MTGLKPKTSKNTKKYLLLSAIFDEKNTPISQPKLAFFANSRADAHTKTKHFQELNYGVYLIRFEEATGDTGFRIETLWMEKETLAIFLTKGTTPKWLLGIAIVREIEEKEQETAEPNWLELLQKMEA